MYIKKDDIKNGLNKYVGYDTGIDAALMDVALLVLEAGESYRFGEPDKEIAVLLFEGDVVYQWSKGAQNAVRPNSYDYLPWCLHIGAGDECTVTANAHSELYVQQTLNPAPFEPVFYPPESIDVQKAGADGQLQGTMRRNIITVFDYSIAPYSNMVLGEVINFAGRWSSYPPHFHPQPEVYFYRFDKPQGFGIGFVDDEVVKTQHNGLALITKNAHPQCAAPGYPMYYIWGIRHLDGDPWIKTRIDEPEHTWMLQKDAHIWNGGE